MSAFFLPLAPMIGVAEPAILVWLVRGGFGLALLILVVLKVIGK